MEDETTEERAKENPKAKAGSTRYNKARKQGYMINGRTLTFEQVGEEEAMIQVQQKMT